MKTPFFFALLAALLACGGASAAPEGADFLPQLVTTRLGVTNATFSCNAGNAGDCHYLLLYSLCQEKFLDDGQKERSCRYKEATPRFQLAPGEHKTVTALVSDFLYATKVGSAPTVEECVRAPLRR